MEAMWVRYMPWHERLTQMSANAHTALSSLPMSLPVTHAPCHYVLTSPPVPYPYAVCSLVSLSSGVLGRVRHFISDFSVRFPPNIQRAFSLDTAGGSLLDIGVYPLYLASAVYGGPPIRVQAMATLTPAGVDDSLSMTLGWPEGRMAQCFSSISVHGPREAHIIGELGRVWVHDKACDRSWYGSIRLTLLTHAGEGREEKEEVFTFPLLDEGSEAWNGANRVLLAYEAQEVHRCLQEGRVESARMPWKETLALSQVMDDIRRQVGVRYPMEEAG